MRKYVQNMTLFHKFAATIILLGLIPMLILSVFISNKMIQDYKHALEIQYEHAAFYLGRSMEAMLSTYNTISQMPYNYNGSDASDVSYHSYDRLREIIHGDHYEPETLIDKREQDMEKFLRYVERTDRYVCAVHFVGVDEKENPVHFHYSSYNGYFKDEELFEAQVGYQTIDKSSRQLMIIPKHSADYYSSIGESVFTVARNYFDIRREVGNERYVGTLFLDVRMKRLELIFHSVKFSGADETYIINDSWDCIYSNIDEKAGTNVRKEYDQAIQAKDELVLSAKTDKYGLHVVVIMDKASAFSNLRTLQKLMYAVLGSSILALVICSVLFSKRLVKPIHAMMEQMAEVENGNFDIQLPVESTDEIGILSGRFNQMSRALKKYIDKYYVAQIRQKEAELTALRSQIYPHFLYNTLEIIRMTAVENRDAKVSEMIEALSAQIHYLIGTVQDMVPLTKEISIIQKYVYLLNCRISGKIQLMVSECRMQQVIVPKLILQPIVENAYIHGIKPKNGCGSISIETRTVSAQKNVEIDDKNGRGSISTETRTAGEDLEISVMDNGIGMNQDELNKIQQLLEGHDPGIKNEYNWQSIGMKNIHDRLKYLYGEQYGIQVTSTPHVGTIVCVRMPVIRGGKDAGQ